MFGVDEIGAEPARAVLDRRRRRVPEREPSERNPAPRLAPGTVACYSSAGN